MHEFQSLTNHFLIAMPGLADPNFAHTVTFICEHNAEGAMGIIINRPIDVTIGEILKQSEIEPSDSFDTEAPAFSGGPVQPEYGFVLHSPPGPWESSLTVSDRIGVTTSRDILTAIAHNEGPRAYLIALGYAGWGAQQLEREMASNTWLSHPADPRILFETPVEKRWSAAAALLGIDLNLMSSEVGHA